MQRSKEYQVPEKCYLLLKWTNSWIEVTLQQGDCEVWGQDLPLLQSKRYQGPSAATIYAHEKSRILVAAQDVTLVSDIIKEDQDYPMGRLTYIAQLLQRKRLEAKAEGGPSPVVFILSQTRLGKSAISKYLVNLSCKEGQRPLYVDLDPNNSVGVKGSIGAGFCVRSFPQDFFQVKEKIIYYCGNDLIPEYYKTMAANFTALVQQKLQKQQGNNMAGTVVTLPPFMVEEKWRECMESFLVALKCDLLVVIGNVQSQIYWQKKRINVIALPEPVTFQSGDGPVSRAQIFFRGLGEPIKSVKMSFRFSEVRIFKLRGGPQGKPLAKEINLKEESIVKAVIALVKCRPDNDPLALAKKLAGSPLLCLAQVGSINLKDQRLEMVLAGDGLQRVLRMSTWVFGDLTFS